MKCCLCKKQISIVGVVNGTGWAHGNNAWPIKDGRCCDKCNKEKVLPVRLKIVLSDCGDMKIKEIIKEIKKSERAFQKARNK